MNDVTDAQSWNQLSPADLTLHLEATHHRYLKAELPHLVALAEKVRSVHWEHHPELAQIHYHVQLLADDLLPHLEREEKVLFPLIRSEAEATKAPDFRAGPPIHCMEIEHEQTAALLAKVRELTNDFTAPADGCPSYQALFAGLAELERDTHLHIEKENNVLFPQALAHEEALAS